MFRGIFALSGKAPRLSLAFALAFTFPLLRLGWGYAAHRQLESLARQQIARGLPGRLANCTPGKKPDLQGVWNSLAQAGNLISKNVEHDDLNDFKKGDSEPPAHDFYQLAGQLESLNSAAYDQVHKASGLPSGNWSGQYKDTFELFSSLPDELDFIQEIIPCLCVSALHHMDRGDINKSLERLDDARNISRFLADEPALTMVAYAVLLDSYRHYCLNILAAKMKPDDLRKNRESIELLIEELMDRGNLRKAADRFFMQSMQGYFVSKKLNGMTLIEPLNDRFEINCALYANAMIDCFTKDAFSKPALPKIKSEILLLETFVDNDATNIIQAVYFTLVSFQQATATNLACQLYRLDHGKLPDSLEQLVPEYLPSIPIDGCNVRFKTEKGFIFSRVIPQPPPDEEAMTPQKIAYLPNKKRPALGINMGARSDPDARPYYIEAGWPMTFPMGETAFIDLNDWFLKENTKKSDD